VLAVVLLFVAVKVLDQVIFRLVHGVARRTRVALDDKIVDRLHRPIVWSALLAGLAWSLELLRLPAEQLALARQIVYTVLSAVIAIGAGRLAHLFVDDYLADLSNVTGLREHMRPFLKNLVNVAVLAGWITVVLMIWDQSLAPILASAGVAGLALSLAARDALANIFGGISIFLEGTYKLGDYLLLSDLASVSRGEVIDIGLRSTRLRTRDDVVVTVPNSIMAYSAIINQSAVKQFRVRIAFGVAYGSDLEHVQRVALGIAERHPQVLDEPKPRLRLRALAASALEYELLCWCPDPALRGRVTNDLNAAIHDSFAREGIVIPFQQVEVRLHREGSTEQSPESVMGR
jgi:small-conductance mechanosensitive channel